MRHRRKTVVGATEVDLPITPMLDMAFQLLVFFIVTYHPANLEAHIDGTLLPPTKTGVNTPKPNDPPPVSIDKDPETKDTVTVIVRAVTPTDIKQSPGRYTAESEGQPRRITLKKKESPDKEDLVGDADQGDSLDDVLAKLLSELKKIKDVSEGTAVDVSVQADGELKHEYFIKVCDACKRAGFQNVGFIAPIEIGKGGK
jgi:biopolymer transport protein ExbD